MPNPHPLPTQDQQRQIVAYLRAGGFPNVAAEAVGVSRRTFRRWLRHGDPACRAFAVAVRAAAAQARLRAEIAVLDAKPLDWLRYGPGKETARRPGWTAAARPVAADAGDANALDRPEFRALLAELTQGLAPFPAAREAVAGVIIRPKSRRRGPAV
jgi:hypothetical protein